ncbi:PepSY domain-containing protein [Elizabethkingia argenteiflava]|uniref:PepSY domain-containing protein n=1 Tax=Elizabethkingia argenteiflava TaxID=2681556 RepID=UPI0021D0F310|nr:PepSY-associated TM helix domain-containing protein [Elizabethkingia argenteiflava]
MNRSQKKRIKKSLAYRIAAWLHLWLVLFSGLIVVIIYITGLTWSFREEIDDLMEPKLHIPDQHKEMLSPAILYFIAKKEYPNHAPTFIQRLTGRASVLGLGKINEGFTCILPPIREKF